MKTSHKTRFDTRLPLKQKKAFEYAANLGGFRTLTEFILYSVQQQASLIIEKHNAILASEKDREIFFNAIMHPRKANAKLKKAARRYNKALGRK